MWLLLIACLVAATAPASAATESGEIRIMTFNVRVDEGTGPEDQWIFRRDRQVALIQEHAPHIIGFQELLKEQLDYLIANLPDYAMIGEGLTGGTGREHNAIFYRRDSFYLREGGSFTLPVIPDRVTWVRLATLDGKEFFVLNTHLHQKDNDPRPWTILLEKGRELFGAGERPVILVGDMNQRAGESLAWNVLTRTSEGEVFKDAWVYPERREGPVASFGFQVGDESYELADWTRRIDWILYMGELTPVSISTLTTDAFEGRYSSDHRAVQVAFQFAPTTLEPPEMAPIDLKAVEISVDSEEIYAGDHFTVDVLVRNLGGVGRAPVTLLVNGEAVSMQEVFFDLGEEKHIQFELQLFQQGTHEISMLGSENVVRVEVFSRPLF